MVLLINLSFLKVEDAVVYAMAKQRRQNMLKTGKNNFFTF